ncbi:MAG: hypothetical protein ACE14T_12155 [Syntrophales bacterium]
MKVDLKSLPLFKDDGKKTERITFAASEDLKNNLECLRKALGRESVSGLVAEYVIECVFRDLGKIELLKARGDRRFIDIEEV